MELSMQVPGQCNPQPPPLADAQRLPGAQRRQWRLELVVSSSRRWEAHAAALTSCKSSAAHTASPAAC
jgi:hypothetical protein